MLQGYATGRFNVQQIFWAMGRASGWIELDRTTGKGLRRPGCTYSTTPKMIFVQPLVTDFREQLCSNSLEGRVWNE